MLHPREAQVIDSILKEAIDYGMQKGFSKDEMLKAFTLPPQAILTRKKNDPILEHMIKRAPELIQEFYSLRITAAEINKLAAEHGIR